MSSATLYRMSGLALLLGALLEIIASIFTMLLFPGENPQQYVSMSWLIVQLLYVLSALLIVAGLPGICARQHAQAGRLGVIGFVLTLVGAILITGLQITDSIVVPYVAANAPQLLRQPESDTTYLLVATLLVIMGAGLLGLATMRAGVFPRLAGLLLIVGAVLNLATFSPLPEIISSIVSTLAGVLLALGLAWMGFALLADKEANLVRPLATTPVSG